jgi:urea transport system permease protein
MRASRLRPGGFLRSFGGLTPVSIRPRRLVKRISRGLLRGAWRVLALMVLSGAALGITASVRAASPQGGAPASAAVAAPGESSPETRFAAVLAQLPSADYQAKGRLIESLERVELPTIKPFLQALLNENVYSGGEGNRVYIANQIASGYELIDPLTGRSTGTVSEDAFDNYNEVGINDQLRTVLQDALAQIDLFSADSSVRLAAVRRMLRQFAYSDNVKRIAATAAMLRAHLATERNVKVREQIGVGLELAALGSSDPAAQLSAIHDLGSNMEPEVFDRLAALADPSAEPDARVRSAAQLAVKHINDWRDFYGSIQTLTFGLGLGAVLALAAIGLAITFGVMGVINMAHGELIMLGAYTTYVMQLLMPNHIGASLLLAVPAAFLVSGLSGVAIERGIVRFLYGRPLETLLATFGVSLALQQLARDVFTAENRPVASPSWMTGSLQINGALSITYNRLYVLVFMLFVFAALLFVMKRTRLGLEVRAVSQNRAMARALGVRSQWVDALAFGLGSGIAGMAGVALSQLTNVGPDLGQSYIVDSFMVVVFGGVGNLWGTVIAGMALGILNMVLEPYAGAVLGKVLVLVGVILFIQRRPRGLFPQRGRAAEV